jgi:hypothetical protein
MVMTASRAWTASVAMLLVLAAACRQLVGIGDDPPTDLGEAGPRGTEAGPTCGIAYTPTQCEACLEQSCCAQASACAAGSACSALEACLGTCDGGVTCRATCVSAHRIGPDPLETQLAACLSSHCASACGIPCGGIAQDFGADAAAGCQACFVNNPGACSAAQACGTAAECRAVDECTQTTPVLDRSEVCWGAHDAGIDAFQAVYDDLVSDCQDSCNFGNQWYCVGKLPKPPQSSPAVTATVAFYDLFTPAVPLPGVLVQVCPPEDIDCSTVLYSTTTGDGGQATLEVPANADTPGPTGYAALSGAGRYPELMFWGFPPSEPFFTGGNEGATVTKGELGVLTGGLPVAVDLDGHATIVVQAFDCEIVRAPGVTFEVTPRDSQTRVLYFAGSTISTTAQSTDPTGFAIIVNVPTGSLVQITATPAALGRASTVIPVVVRPGALTTLGAYVNQ